MLLIFFSSRKEDNNESRNVKQKLDENENDQAVDVIEENPVEN